MRASSRGVAPRANMLPRHTAYHQDIHLHFSLAVPPRTTKLNLDIISTVFFFRTRALNSKLNLHEKKQSRRFLRRLKLDIDDDERAALLDALAGGGDDRASGEKGVSFESDGGDGKAKRRAKRGGDNDKSGGDDGGVEVLYRDFLELVLAEQVATQPRFSRGSYAVACFLDPFRKSTRADLLGAGLVETVVGSTISTHYDTSYTASRPWPSLWILQYGGWGKYVTISPLRQMLPVNRHAHGNTIANLEVVVRSFPRSKPLIGPINLLISFVAGSIIYGG